MVRLANLHEQVTGDAPGGSRIALAPKVELHAVFDTGGNLDLDDRLLPAQAVLVGVLRLRLDAPPQAATGGTGGCGLHLAENGVADLSDLTGSAAGLAGVVFHPFGLDEPEHLDLLGHAFGNLLQGQLDLDAQIGPLGPARSPGASAPKRISKGPAEDVSELAEDVVHVHAGTAASCAAHARMAEAVVFGPFLLVAQDLIGLGCLLEPPLGIRVIGILVRVVLDGQLPVGLLDVGLAGPSVDAEDFVEVALGHACDQLPTTTLANRRTLS